MSEAGIKKFFCARKHKFSLNLQGVCDARGRFLDIDIGYLGSASDHLAFIASSLRTKLERPGFLAPNLVLHGDNAHALNTYVVKPHKNVGDGSPDAHNFYHSKERIRIECTFGVLVHRWEILQKPMLRNLSLGKITTLICYLCKLHNFSIIKKEEKYHEQTKIDEFHAACHGSIDFEIKDGNQLPCDMLNGGEHSDDFNKKVHLGISHLVN